MSLAFALSKPFLHAMDAESSHRATIALLKCAPKLGAPLTSAKLKRKVLGLDFPNPVGLAPGFDKNAEVPDAMLAQGFGFVEIGTVTPLPQAGNTKPRLFRLSEDMAVINRMGFNNEGHDVVLQRLVARRARGGIVGVNIGANKDASDRIADYVTGMKVFENVASYITINISSPNTPGLRNLQGKADLQRLLERVNAARKTSKPVLLKIAPDLAEADLADIASVVQGGAVDGVIISNTTLSRLGLRSPHAGEQGGLSGAPLFDLSTQCLASFHRLTEGKIPLIGVGGITSAETALAKFRAGASLVQIYSGLVFKGPALVREICAAL
ncbi:quinone-dependent dihydroorotate dehydrogenase [Aestuariivirga litoralis]|uniref:quinone-dependent dihydroorotate dehydrogenase n=1 Tax=Aestuariivirga litoralis TaxID=2650924 RepID=UPI0018C682FE|nr:quinone-dependent dihydroorotate dehydrogenase [Aestuariivirga litoralis]MBG1232953.1 quinone-dependent dihydroorotate dehydrogenase [Aestuariivirga litoralis]